MIHHSENFDLLIERIRTRATKWKSLLKEYEMKMSDFAKKDEPSLLDSSWKPVKISPHATIESRGADMNSISKIIALSNILKTLSKYVEENSINIFPSDIGNKEPFKLEDKNLYVPTFNYLKELEKNSALLGFEKKSVLNYSKRLIELSEKINTPKISVKIFKNIIDEEKTESDYIIDYVKKKQGYVDVIEEENAKNLALIKANSIYKEVLLAKKMSEKEI